MPKQALSAVDKKLIHDRNQVERSGWLHYCLSCSNSEFLPPVRRDNRVAAHRILCQISENPNPPKSLTYGWQRAQLLGAFFNGVLLLGLGISVFLQSIERFISLQRVFSSVSFYVSAV